MLGGVRAIRNGTAEQVFGALPVGERFLAQPGTPLGPSLRFQQIAQAYPQPDTAHEAEADGQAQRLGLGQEPFPELWLASERHGACGEDRLRLPTQCPPGIVQERSSPASILFYVSADAVPAPDALLRVQQIHQPRPETEATKQPQRFHD